MTIASERRGPMFVRCPICARRQRWDALAAVRRGATGQLTPLVDLDPEDPIRRAENRLDAYRQCPGNGPEDAHLLPYAYADYGPPVVLGVIAGGAAGKSHLLAAMIGTLLDAAGRRNLPLRVDPLDFDIHEQYERQVMRPFLQQRAILPVTRAQAVEFTDALRVHNTLTGRTHAVAFFDVGGERLQQHRDNAFLGALNALLFVVDGNELLQGRRGQAPPLIGDVVSDSVLDRLGRLHGYTPGGFLPLPAAVVVAKADLLRFTGEEGVDEWFDEDDEAESDLSRLEEESRDVYRLLSRRGAPYLRSARKCLVSTLHLASAAGVEPEGDRFPQFGFGPRRVLRPLLALFSALGVLQPGVAGDQSQVPQR